MSAPSLIGKCKALPSRALLLLYSDLLAESPHDCALPALALRDQARAGSLDEDIVPMLAVCLVDAPNNAVFIHLAKALAAFGRDAQFASGYIVERLEKLQITNDRRFWVLDSGLWCLGYLGGDVARRFVDGLAAESPSRVLRSKSVYEGELVDDERQAMHARTLEQVSAMIHADDAGQWREKKTELQFVTAAETKATPKKPWMTR